MNVKSISKRGFFLLRPFASVAVAVSRKPGTQQIVFILLVGLALWWLFSRFTRSSKKDTDVVIIGKPNKQPMPRRRNRLVVNTGNAARLSTSLALMSDSPTYGLSAESYV